MWLLFAQVADPISGGAGWVGTGLLGMVLAWLLTKHLPAKDAQLKEIMESHAHAMALKDDYLKVALNDQAIHHDRSQAQAREDFKTALKVVVDHCEDEMVGMTKMMEKDIAGLIEALKRPNARMGDLDDLETRVRDLKAQLERGNP